ncbi:hypothetical protein Sango_2899000 [Sesamum angolense]|uniref:BED-type domain-containing protein n=1 Tax=Sesamum angolense TaxID=2727404 RepID=A0AAE1T6M5_9LAMI|nr:hypothetical protein Sango_2899000 [Sesamum angolense]
MSTCRSESSQPTSRSGDNEDVTTQSRSSKRKQSVVWEHFTKVRGVNDTLHAKCNYCEILLSGGAANGTNHLKKHLNNACPKFKLELRIGLSGSPRYEFKFDQVKSQKAFALACIKHRVRDKIVNMFINYGGSLAISMNESNVMSSSGVETRASLRDFDRWCYESRVSNNQKSELESYLEEARFPRAETFNILDWWKTNSPRLPILAKIARDIPTVPATTVASKATFSVSSIL